MPAACSTSYSRPLRIGVGQRHSPAPAAWQAAPTGARGAFLPTSVHAARPAAEHRRSSSSSSRVAPPPPCSSSTAAADLAVYQFAQRRAGATAEWFQEAVRDIVRHVDASPFLQTVQLGGGTAPPRLNTYGVHDSVVAAPELWQGIAEHVGQDSPDVVILVQRVNPLAADSPQGAMEAAAAAAAAQQQHSSSSSTYSSSVDASSSSSSRSPPGSPRAHHTDSGSPLRSQGSHEVRVQAEEACRRLVSSGLADRILTGQVGDCCDDDVASHHAHGDDSGSSAAPSSSSSAAAARPLPLPAIVPFSPPAAAARRTAVRAAAALRPMGAAHDTGGSHSSQQAAAAAYWGVVVQSKGHTGAEGCYLLKTVRNVTPATGCTCTHFSLTRVAAGEHLEAQFVKSWLL